MKSDNQKLLIGAHTSAAGGVQNALYEGKKIGATTIQLFTNNQKQWKPRELTQDTIQLWKKALAETEIEKVMSHDSYLINLGSPNEEVLEKSLHAFKHEILRCKALGISFLNFHPGAALHSSREACLDRIVKSLLTFKNLFENNPTRLLLETTAGQGTTVGNRFEEVGYIIERVKDHLPIGVCIDTCHIFAAGYDLRTNSACDATLKEFDAKIGLKHLFAFHLNDSMKPFDSRVDRHASLGEGEIGLEAFSFLMNDARVQGIPKYLETPKPEIWDQEIIMLKNMVK